MKEVTAERLVPLRTLQEEMRRVGVPFDLDLLFLPLPRRRCRVASPASSASV
jgi:hypothetical protein